MEKPDQLVVGVEEAARLIDSKKSFVYLQLQTGKLPFVMIGNRKKVRITDLQAYIDSCVAPPPPVTYQPPRIIDPYPEQFRQIRAGTRRRRIRR